MEISIRERSSALSVPTGPAESSKFSNSCVGRFTNGQARSRVALHFIHKAPGHRESLYLTTHFMPAHTAHTMKPRSPRHIAERWQYKFNLHLGPQRRSGGGQYKHSALTNVYAVSGVVVAPTVGPAEQDWQHDLEPPRTSSLDGMIHIRTQFPFAGWLTISRGQEVSQAGDRPQEDGAVLLSGRRSPSSSVATSSLSQRDESLGVQRESFGPGVEKEFSTGPRSQAETL